MIGVILSNNVLQERYAMGKERERERELCCMWCGNLAGVCVCSVIILPCVVEVLFFVFFQFFFVYMLSVVCCS